MINKSKYISKYNKNNVNESNYLGHLLLRIIISILLFLIVGIVCKTSIKGKEFIYNNVFNNNWSFTAVKSFYDKYLGGVIPSNYLFDDPVESVFNENLVYSDKNKYLDGVSLTVGKEYLVPSLEDGIVVYIGEKEGYNNTIIVQSMAGIDYWYGNLTSNGVNLYDYIEKGNLLGSANDKLYLVFSSNGSYLNYEEYLS
ncbi:MAG: M23 family metallopeptidase [bacterium]|nr:M23 family metallopeptidase [bacterium]